MRVCVCVCVCVRVCVYAHTCVHACTRACVRVCVCMSLCARICAHFYCFLPVLFVCLCLSICLYLSQPYSFSDYAYGLIAVLFFCLFSPFSSCFLCLWKSVSVCCSASLNLCISCPVGLYRSVSFTCNFWTQFVSSSSGLLSFFLSQFDVFFFLVIYIMSIMISADQCLPPVLCFSFFTWGRWLNLSVWLLESPQSHFCATQVLTTVFLSSAVFSCLL